MATRAANKRASSNSDSLEETCLLTAGQLTREYQTIQQNPPPYIVAHPSESNILE